MKLMGCLGSILALIVIVFVLTHLSEIWSWLEGIFA
ncbi:MAG: hypothetical protein LLF82_000921 [Dehalococcoides mccartyi]|jgi:hypothetical protein|uniref:Uncharacterized protein n=1 Tax=bioreactor metagenome TaxID=1076179 RepID=A0A644STA3_9ZZZZ|nr:hypothetical protein X793_01635 [Dehalococcoides mccartyi CG4]MCF7635438.1 hypothetical protein [Dehalococcoides mccartyi]MEA2120929.1 hypothetical protein [Dehalococcoides mccartyi]MEA2123110.1 hypothetical protein [Dehalococcoides mccartyi]